MSRVLPTSSPDHWRNFLWALRSPDIAPEFPLPWLPETRREALLTYFLTPGMQSRLAPQLEQQLHSSTSRRLGIYFENLWAFAFSHHPHYQLVARNLPIRDQGRTLGELDFVVRHLPDNTVEHWELALKFYLQVGSLWVGPGLKDRLDIKLARMRDHQLPIARNPLATAALRETGVQLDRQWALMPGRLFRPLTEMPGPGKSAPPAATDFWWADLATFLRAKSGEFTAADTRWVHLPKPCWLAPQTGPLADAACDTLACDTSACTPSTLKSDLRERLATRGPICVAMIGPQGETGRGFLVPDDWRQRAAQSRPN